MSNIACRKAFTDTLLKLAKEDKDIITSDVVAKISKKINKKLSLSNEFGDFDGGVILSGEKFDKNLTFALEFSMLREESEAELAKILFGE